MILSYKTERNRRQSGRRPSAIHSIVRFPVARSGTAERFLCYPVETELRKVASENCLLLRYRLPVFGCRKPATGDWQLKFTSGSERKLCSLPPSCVYLRAS